MRTNLIEDVTCFESTDVLESGVVVDARAYYLAFYRAACLARSHLLIAGWQFDTDVALLRGDDAEAAPYPVTFLAFLDALCRERPELRVFVLAWDHSVVYALEREWMQQFKFAFQSSPAIRFEFDAHPHYAGSQHQKFVVADGSLAFVGGLDICDSRWDERTHHGDSALRVDRAGAICRPNHEVQAFVRGAAIDVLTRVFVDRWFGCCGEKLELRAAPAPELDGLDLVALDNQAIFPLRASRVGISRTMPGEPPQGVQEVKAAYHAAFSGAERLIYLETQYFTSRSITASLLERLRDPEKPRLEVLMILPQGADTSKEKFAFGELQDHMLGQLIQAGQEHGHTLRVLCSAAGGVGCNETTFIHSKLIAVDDEFLMVGSANMTERSMGLDSELCLSWQGEAGSELASDIGRLRASLLGEHAGTSELEFLDPSGLAGKVDDLLALGQSRLRICRIEETTSNALKNAIFDPGGPTELPASFGDE